MSDFLDSTPGDTPEPVLLPEGIYDFTIKSYRADQVGDNQNTKVTVTASPVQVVEGELEESDLQYAIPVRMEYWATDNALSQGSPVISLKQFMKRVLDMSSDEVAEMSYGQLLEMLIGQQFRGVAKRDMVGRNNDIEVAVVSRILDAA